jgi:Domain of unknown function (DUF1883)/TIR domain
MSEQYIYNDLGQCQAGTRVKVTLSGSAANVFLVDSSNYSNYRTGRDFRYTGGMFTQSPVILTVPSPGHWYGIVDLRGLGGRVNARFERLPSALPHMRQVPMPSLDVIRPVSDQLDPATATDMPQQRQWDVFISHATEDKEDVVRPLAVALQELGLDVWYDEFELNIGDSLRRKIDAGLASSRFGVVVLSTAFFAKNWPQYELDGLVTREMSGTDQVILPLWHNITKDQVIAKSPSLADKVARTTASSTIAEIAKEIEHVVSRSRVSR